MKTYQIPWPYDYHGQGEVLVRANSPEEAIKLAKEKLGLEKWTHREAGDLKVAEIVEYTDVVYVNYGCDC